MGKNSGRKTHQFEGPQEFGKLSFLCTICARMTLRQKLFGLFFVSGFCGLLYQVVWVRLAFAHFGVITPVLSVIVSVFMLGLSIGSWAAGKWIAPLTPYSVPHVRGRGRAGHGFLLSSSPRVLFP